MPEMEPMQAWGIIQANLLQLYEFRRVMAQSLAADKPKNYTGFSDNEAKAYVMAFSAFKLLADQQAEQK